MLKKLLLTVLICSLVITAMVGTVMAAENTEEESLHREMAIACAMSYVPLQENKKMSECFNLNKIKLISSVVNYFNAKINLHDYANINEIDDWTVVDFHNKEFTEKSMAAFVLKKDNNLMIVFRGTDTELIGDVKYGFNNYHDQEEYAKKYVISILDEYKSQGEFNIYVAGHSLGGYLAQIAGATIEQTITANSETYSNIKLKQVVDFNGIGINFLTELGDTEDKGNQSENIATLKKLGDEGRLVEYYTYGDLVSALGVHYGEMRRLLPSLDSVSYHRYNFSTLGYLNGLVGLNDKLNTIVANNKSDIIDIAAGTKVENIFKTEIAGAKDLYQLDNSLVAYLFVTHESDTFAQLGVEKVKDDVKVQVTDKDSLISFFTSDKGKDTISTIKKSITLRATTLNASAKRYEWYSSDDGKNWTLENVSTLYSDDAEYDANTAPTNTFTVNVSNIPTGSSKQYKVIAYYDDNYIASRFKYNADTKVYEYEELSDTTQEYDEGQSVEKEFVVKHKTSILEDISSEGSTNGIVDFIVKIINQIISRIKEIIKSIIK